MTEAPTMRGSGQCPVCGCRKTARTAVPPDIADGFFGEELEVCLNRACGAAWQPIDMALLWDPSDPLCSFSEPCDNCAFRPGSHEQRTGKLAALVTELKTNPYAQFYCHKGVPIDPKYEKGDSGFAYPKDAKGAPQLSKMRLCRGWLRTWLPGLRRETVEKAARDSAAEVST